MRFLRTLAFTRTLALLPLFLAADRLSFFDASPTTLKISRYSRPFIRWDIFHFVHIAEHGYVYEYEWAFFPGTPLIMRLASALLTPFGVSRLDGMLTGGGIAAMLCSTNAIVVLYELSLHHLRSPNLAYLTAMLSLMPSSPATLLLVPYTESFFTYLSYKGMLYAARTQYFYAAIAFSLAGLFRSNAVFLSGFIIWGLLIDPFLSGGKSPTMRSIFNAAFFTGLVFAPFIHHNYRAYTLFCASDVPTPPPFCSEKIPLIYNYVQSKYWNVGLLRYWTLQQLPNFIIATPPLLLIVTFSVYHIKHGFIRRLRTLMLRAFESNGPTVSDNNIAPTDLTPSQTLTNAFLSPSITPHAIHALLLSSTLLFASHTQIILRLAAAMPLTYWAAAWLICSHPLIGQWWLRWSIIWGLASIILWGAFLPPA